MNLFRNMHVSKKLFVAFSVMILFILIVGFSGILGMQALSRESLAHYNNNTLAMTYLAKVYDALAGQRLCASNMALFNDANTAWRIFSMTEKEALSQKEELFETNLAAYATTIVDAKEQDILTRLTSLYESDFAQAKEALLTHYAQNDTVAMTKVVYELDLIGVNLSAIIDEAFDYNLTLSQDKVASNQRLYENSALIIVIILVIASLLAIVLIYLISQSISPPLNRLLLVAKQAGDTGNMDFETELIGKVRTDAQSRDEIGQLSDAFANMMDQIALNVHILETISQGDLTVTAVPLSEKDTLGNALAQMLSSLNTMFSGISNTATQVSVGAKQIFDGAQSLADGANEQASAIEELSSAIDDVSKKASQTSQRINEASSLSSAIEQDAAEGSVQMSALLAAIKDINTASKAISSVINLIDELAFQTSILSLNAAVEAAKAGQHGRGFAVVAEEVRSLAKKSADAAKNTNGLIENAIQKAQQGVEMTERTNITLQQITTRIQESANIAKDVAIATESQVTAIAQINIGIDQISQIVQQNSASSEESASASESMSMQAVTLSDLIAQFKVKASANDMPPVIPHSALTPPPSTEEKY